jgi:hypothetical protein
MENENAINDANKIILIVEYIGSSFKFLKGGTLAQNADTRNASGFPTPALTGSGS